LAFIGQYQALQDIVEIVDYYDDASREQFPPTVQQVPYMIQMDPTNPMKFVGAQRIINALKQAVGVDPHSKEGGVVKNEFDAMPSFLKPVADLPNSAY
jgi:hypothetical protein